MPTTSHSPLMDTMLQYRHNARVRSLLFSSKLMVIPWIKTNGHPSYEKLFCYFKWMCCLKGNYSDKSWQKQLPWWRNSMKAKQLVGLKPFFFYKKRWCHRIQNFWFAKRIRGIPMVFWLFARFLFTTDFYGKFLEICNEFFFHW